MDLARVCSHPRGTDQPGRRAIDPAQIVADKIGSPGDPARQCRWCRRSVVPRPIHDQNAPRHSRSEYIGHEDRGHWAFFATGTASVANLSELMVASASP